MAERVWSEKDLVRRANRRLAVLRHAEEISGSVAATCRYYGISRTVFYRWKHRYEDKGLDGRDTVLSGVFVDQAAFYGAVSRCEALGLELVEIRRLPPPGC